MSPPEERAQRPQALSAGHFKRIAHGGWGDGHNAYAYSSTWFRDHVYIGSNRYVLPLIFKQATWDIKLDPPPVPIPSYYDMDLCGQIWRYSPDNERWDRAYRAPLVDGPGRKVPLFISYRCMTVFQAQSEDSPSLYLVPIQGRGAPRRVMLYSPDGYDWRELPSPLCEGEAGWRSWRGIIPFKGRLFAAPASGQVNFQSQQKEAEEDALTKPNTASGAFVRCTEDPLTGRWEASSLPDMGDPTNRSIMDMEVCGDHLYVGTLNIREGCQLWRTDGEGPPPHRWEKVLDRGADRGPLNQAIQSMAAFQGSLYFGTCIQNGGHDKENHIGPAAGEVIRFNPQDGSWDLIMGDARPTRRGFVAPRSGHTQGFTNPFSGYIWRMCVHDGALYVGTGELTAALTFVERSLWPEAAQRVFDEETLHRFLQMRGGAELWRTTDGDHWVPVTVNGFGNIYNGGIRGLISTPRGLFVGTANPYGRQVAVKGPGGWRYVDNPRGGVEVWHGHPDHIGIELPSEGIMETLSGERPGPDSPIHGSEPAPVRSIVDAGPERTGAGPEEELWNACRVDPLLALSLEDRQLVQPEESVEAELARYFGGSELRNVGFWRTEAISPREAARELVSELLRFLPDESTATERRKLPPPPEGAPPVIPGEEPREEPPAPPSRALWIGRGGAEAAELLLARGIQTVSLCLRDAVEARAAKRAHPDLNVMRWSRGGLPRGARDFGLILWVEGPSGEPDRVRTLARLRERLATGGRLLATDAIPARGEGELDPEVGERLVNEYREDLKRAGFVDPHVVDVTARTWRPFYSHSRRIFFVKKQFLHVDAARQREVFSALPGGDERIAAYVTLSARRRF